MPEKMWNYVLQVYVFISSDRTIVKHELKTSLQINKCRVIRKIARLAWAATQVLHKKNRKTSETNGLIIEASTKNENRQTNKVLSTASLYKEQAVAIQ